MTCSSLNMSWRCLLLQIIREGTFLLMHIVRDVEMDTGPWRSTDLEMYGTETIHSDPVYHH